MENRYQSGEYTDPGERALSPMGLDLSAGRLATHTLHREKHHETESDYRTWDLEWNTEKPERD